MNPIDILNCHKNMLITSGLNPSGIEVLDTLIGYWSSMENPVLIPGRLSTNRPATLGGYLISCNKIFGEGNIASNLLTSLINERGEISPVPREETFVAYSLGMYILGHPIDLTVLE